MAMAMEKLQTQALKALASQEYDLAVKLFTEAISVGPPDNAELFTQRSLAYLYLEMQRSLAYLYLEMFTESRADAERAIELNPGMHIAYFYKGNACFELKDYHTAKAALEAGSFRVPGNAKFINLIKKCDERIAASGSRRPPNPSLERQRIDADDAEVEVKNLEEAIEKSGSDACRMNIRGTGSETPSDASSKRQMVDKVEGQETEEKRAKLGGHAAVVSAAVQRRRLRRRRWND